MYYYLADERSIDWDAFEDKGDHYIIKRLNLSRDRDPDAYIKIIKDTNQVIFNKAPYAEAHWLEAGISSTILIDI